MTTSIRYWVTLLMTNRIDVLDMIGVDGFSFSVNGGRIHECFGIGISELASNIFDYHPVEVHLYPAFHHVTRYEMKRANKAYGGKLSFVMDFYD